MPNMLNKIFHGNCLEVLQKIPSNSVDLIFADPPYWMRVEGILKRPEGKEFDGCDDEWDNTFSNNDDYVDFTRKWLSQCQRILKQNGSIWRNAMHLYNRWDYAKTRVLVYK